MAAAAVARTAAVASLAIAAVVLAYGALDEFSLAGTQTTVPLLREILDDPRFVSGDYDTAFLERRDVGEASRVEQPENSGTLVGP